MNNLLPHLKMLGFGGLLPFVVLLAGLLMTDNKGQLHPVLQDLFIYYAAIIVTFVGGLNWGVALANEALSLPQRKVLLTYSVLPALIAWILLLLPSQWYLVVMAFVYLGCFVVDSRLTLPSMPVEYADMRRKLSFSVAGILLLGSQLVV